MTFDELIDSYIGKISLDSRQTSVSVIRGHLKHFAADMGVEDINDVTSMVLLDFSVRQSEAGWKPSTINQKVRAVGQCLRFGVDILELPIKKLPSFRWLKVDNAVGDVINHPSFAMLFTAASAAKHPATFEVVTPAQWWQAFMGWMMMTGWRVSQTLELQRKNVDLGMGVARAVPETVKGGKEAFSTIPLTLADLVRPLYQIDSDLVFPLTISRRRLYDDFARIQDEAGLESNTGGYMGFHAFRRGFATENAMTLTAAELQGQMQHESYKTTQRYIDMADRCNVIDPNKLKNPELPGESDGEHDEGPRSQIDDGGPVPDADERKSESDGSGRDAWE